MAENKTQTNEAQSTRVSRRDMFQIIGSVPARLRPRRIGNGTNSRTCGDRFLYPAAIHARSFDEHQWRTVHVLCDLIIPADDLGGSATQAGAARVHGRLAELPRGEDDNDDLTAQVIGGLSGWTGIDASSDKPSSTAPPTSKSRSSIASPGQTVLPRRIAVGRRSS